MADKKLVLYFNFYQVAGYEMGYPSVDLKYESNKDLFKTNLAKQKFISCARFVDEDEDERKKNKRTSRK